jgi:hypothetical protein
MGFNLGAKNDKGVTPLDLSLSQSSGRMANKIKELTGASETGIADRTP